MASDSAFTLLDDDDAVQEGFSGDSVAGVEEIPAAAAGSFPAPDYGPSQQGTSSNYNNSMLEEGTPNKVESDQPMQQAQALVLSPTPSSALSSHIRDPPRAHVDQDLGIGNLAQALHILGDNQQRLDDAENVLQALMRQRARLVAAGRLLEQQKLLDVLAAGPELGYDRGRPVAALLVHRCCVRWGAFSGDAQAAAVLDHVTALLAAAVDEDAINARHAAAAGDSEAGDQAQPGAVASQGAVLEMAYWLSVTVTLLALVDPLVPLAQPKQPAALPAAAAPVLTPLAAVAGDARASVTRAAHAAAAKVQELQKRMGSTFSGMGLLGKSLLSRGKKGKEGAAGAAPAESVQRQGSEGGASADVEAAMEVSAQAAVTTAPLPPASPPEPPSALAPLPPPPPPHPCQAFRSSLDLLAQKAYAQVRDSLKRGVSAVLQDCVQAPGGGAGQQQLDRGGSWGLGSEDGRALLERARGSLGGESVCSQGEGGAPSGALAAPSLAAWDELVAVLAGHLALLRQAHVPRIVIRCLFKQTLSFINVQLFNQLLLRPECCCTSNARYLVAGLQRLDGWLAGAGGGSSQAGEAAGADAAAGPAHGPGPAPLAAAGEDLALLAEDLRHVRQACHFLALANKGALRLEDILAMCPALNVQQLYRLATTFWDDCPPPQQQHMQASRQASLALQAAVEEGEKGQQPKEEGAGSEGTEPGVAQDEGEGARQEEAGAGREEEEAVDDGLNSAAPGEDAAAAATADVSAGTQAEDPLDTLPSPTPAPPPVPAPPPPAPPAVSRNVSGEVLEEMKRRHAVANNGGLIVTFLLDEDGAPMIAPGGAVALQLLRLVDQPPLHEGLVEGLPPAMCGEDCPPQVFGFLLLPEGAEAGAEKQGRGGGRGGGGGGSPSFGGWAGGSG